MNYKEDINWSLPQGYDYLQGVEDCSREERFQDKQRILELESLVEGLRQKGTKETWRKSELDLPSQSDNKENSQIPEWGSWDQGKRREERWKEEELQKEK